MSLLDNAIESIRTGVEDYEQGTARRLASAIRNFYAGVLLLLKEKLRRMSPPDSNDALIWERVAFAVSTNGAVSFRGVGSRTVDTRASLERFEQLGLRIDAAPLKKLQKIRNNVEHHSATETAEQMQEAIAATFYLVREIITTHLAGDPASMLGAPTWTKMLTETEMYDEHLRRCRDSTAALQGVPDAAREFLDECPQCGSELVEALGRDYGHDTRFACRACGLSMDTERLISRQVSRAYYGASYDAFNNGSEMPIGECAICLADAYNRQRDVCLACGADSGTTDHSDDSAPYYWEDE